MPTKISEKRLLASILFVAGALILFFTARLTYAPVHVSEKGLVAVLAAIVMLILGMKLFHRAIQKV